MEEFKTIGEELEKVHTAYDNAKKKLEPNGHSIIVTANHLLEIGANKGKSNNIPRLPEYDEVEAEEVDDVEEKGEGETGEK